MYVSFPSGKEVYGIASFIRGKWKTYYALAATTASGQYQVDWGDGTVELFRSGTSVGVYPEHTYDVASLTSPVTEDGFKTVLVTITPVVPEGFRTFYINYSHSADNRTQKSSGLLYVRGRVPGVTSLVLGSSGGSSRYWNNPFLESVDLLETGQMTSFVNVFAQCYRLKHIPQLDTSSGTRFNYMFAYCYSLKKLPSLDTSQGTLFGAMFQSCASLARIPQLDPLCGELLS